MFTSVPRVALSLIFMQYGPNQSDAPTAIRLHIACYIGSHALSAENCDQLEVYLKYLYAVGGQCSWISILTNVTTADKQTCSSLECTISTEKTTK
ncbi:hypothetical protein FGIG_07844 [Fasciola gigantica]|uniref:Uncharacterized protein n=1 Tax=Fasciola gigantica TaxID=46835 RepID=A0A504YMH7_FASGI|nr:hypothetical protein FGIG_07844 [Fasciola gigantica]